MIDSGKSTEAADLREALERVYEWQAGSNALPLDLWETIRAALSPTPQPLPDAPGLREAAAPFVKHYADWMDKWPDDHEVSVYPRHTYGQIRALIAALSTTPQPVAVPAEREELGGLVTFLEDAAKYFEKRPTNGEDKAVWANVYNAENCRKAAATLARFEAGA